MCPKPVTNQKKVKDHVISVSDPLSSHVYCQRKVRPEKKRTRLMNSTKRMSGKWKRWHAPVSRSEKLSRFRPVTFSFSKVHSPGVWILNVPYGTWSLETNNSLIHFLPTLWRCGPLPWLMPPSHFTGYHYLQTSQSERLQSYGLFLAKGNGSNDK